MDIARQRDDGPLARRLLGRARLAAPLATAGLAVAAGGLLLAVPKEWYWAVALILLSAGLSARASHTGPLDWLVPAALRAAEYIFVIGVGIAGGVPRPLVFVLLFAIAMHHYDLTARPVAKQHVTDLGWDGRVALLAVAAAASAASQAVFVLAVYLCLVFGVRAVAGWLPEARSARSGRRPAGVHSGAQAGGM
jgi:hypothetical protein